MSEKIPVTQRGFRIFAEFDHAGQSVTVQESSLATEYKVWVGGESRLHLNVEEATIIRAALDDFINDRHERTVDKEWPPPVSIDPTVYVDVEKKPSPMWTSHGHRNKHVLDDGTPRPASVARCGGPGVCTQCSKEVARG